MKLSLCTAPGPLPALYSCVLTQAYHFWMFTCCSSRLHCEPFEGSSLTWPLRTVYEKDVMTQKKYEAEIPFYVENCNRKWIGYYLLLGLPVLSYNKESPCPGISIEGHDAVFSVHSDPLTGCLNRMALGYSYWSMLQEKVFLNDTLQI